MVAPEAGQRGQPAPSSQGDHGDREENGQPEEHRAPLPVGELVLEAGLGARVVREHDPVAGIEVGGGRRLGELERDRLALVGALVQPHPELVTADVVCPGRPLARLRVLRDHLGVVDVAGQVELLGALHVTAAAEREHAHQR